MIRLSKSNIGEEEIEAVTKVLKNEYLGMGQDVKEFEEILTKYFDRPTICVNTGTSALQLALQAIGLTVGDEVLIQSLTYVASYQAISATGAIPVSCEVIPETMTIDIEDAKKKITSKTKAIMPVHYGGGVGNLDDVYKFAKLNNLRVIEDAAHAFGSQYKNQLVGSFGDICCFSFDGIKNITSGEGGAIVSNDENVINKIKDYRLLGVEKDTDKRYAGERSWEFDVTEQGWRYHMSNIMAAIGKEQFKKISLFKEKRQRFAKLYQDHLNNVEGIVCLNHNYSDIVPHIFMVRILNSKREVVKEFLNSQGVQTGMHYFPNHYLSKYKSNDIELKLTDIIYKEMLTLPLHTGLLDDDVINICSLIKKVLKEL